MATKSCFAYCMLYENILQRFEVLQLVNSVLAYMILTVAYHGTIKVSGRGMLVGSGWDMLCVVDGTR